MKVAILTLPLHTNYGGILQAYALQTVLEQLGHEVVVLEQEKQPEKMTLKRLLKLYIKRIIKNLIGRKCFIFYERRKEWEYPIISQHTQKFISEYIHRKIINFKNLRENDFDAIVVGSDQIWRPCMFSNIEDAYLKFTTGWHIKRISYAASLGVDNWEYSPEQTKECRRLIQKFNAISVREKSSIDLLKEYFNVNACHVLDPTLLLTARDYLNFCTDVPESEGTLLIYILDECTPKLRLVNKIAKEKNLKPFSVTAKAGNVKCSIEERIYPCVESWLKGFHDAKFVVTDSFHACVFAILFKKQFVVYGNRGRGMARFHSLLQSLNMEDRLITDLSKYKKMVDIDYDSVYVRLEQLKKSSFSYLKYALAINDQNHSSVFEY